jgi:hypothetical protein
MLFSKCSVMNNDNAEGADDGSALIGEGLIADLMGWMITTSHRQTISPPYNR